YLGEIKQVMLLFTIIMEYLMM
ncbi:uncharacterized protein METZ01_LOCUS364153, partial [marine metagenome]